jgi:hypothetical protein
MPSADQVPVISPHSMDALALMGCPDRRIDQLCITCCYLRSLFTAGALAVIRYAKMHGSTAQ